MFLMLAFGLSWLAWAPLVLAALRGGQATRYFHLVGGMGPAIAALVMAGLSGRSTLRELVHRADPRRTPSMWLALAVLAPIGLYVIAVTILRVAGQPWPRLADVGASKEYPELGRALYWAANILCYGYGEEIGWRGYLLRTLQVRRKPLVAALIVSVVWSFWHLPLFWFAAGMLAMGPAEIAGWFFSMVTGSVLMTWLFNSSGGSVAAVALFHGVLDIVMGSPGHPMTVNIMGGVLTVWGIAAAFRTERVKIRAN